MSKAKDDMKKTKKTIPSVDEIERMIQATKARMDSHDAVEIPATWDQIRSYVENIEALMHHYRTLEQQHKQ